MGSAPGSMMTIRIVCEESGRVREAFRALGHDAKSCELVPSALPGPHIQGDARELIQKKWDLVIAHPLCTYLCNSDVTWMHERQGRWAQMVEAAGSSTNALLPMPSGLQLKTQPCIATGICAVASQILPCNRGNSGMSKRNVPVSGRGTCRRWNRPVSLKGDCRQSIVCHP